MIKALQPEYNLRLLCEVLDVSVSGYYSWRTRPVSERRKENLRLTVEIKAAHEKTRKTYSPERLQQELMANGIHVSLYRIRKVRKMHGIVCKQKQKFKATTNSNHKLPVAPNILNQEFTASAPNQAWLTDITYVPTDEGWLYLAGHKDLYSKKLVGYAMSERMTKNLVMQSLQHAVELERPGKGLIHHSDRGSQYCSNEFRQQLERYGMQSSMSRRGNCYDNAPIESFWGILKTELIYHKRYATRQEAIRNITEYIEVFYNRQRMQRGLGYLSPAAFEQKYYKERKTA
ncbi:Integrase catalytic region [Desulfurispirillum indicum S5]|uniref:Integrase catalytic region n=1 Tax=Desulfurispirillum indicum (strain ATCC BAA-1389 / DSM 22839 / S5) TaxID=653733 RepID=E6W2G9_DESIS|nr:Integrase catalytic region [Desulfurispirillum indicum S5]